ncbi:MAG TPA: tetratricopeptide repeat protein [Kofleriaceae bacterium]|nr:tetratricopeptide repeat protein [Kofleriaceae bacterium]
MLRATLGPLGLAILLTACAGRAAHPTAPSPGPAATSRADDLAARAHQPPAATGNPGDLEARPGTGAAGGPYDLGEIKLIVTGKDPDGEPHIEAVSPSILLDQAQAAIDAGRPQVAVGVLARLAEEFPGSPMAPSAMFNIGRIHEQLGDVADAIAAYRDLVARYPTGRESLDGHLRIAGLEAEHKQWPDAARTLAEILARTDLTYADRLQAQARLGYVQLESGDRDAARASLEAAVVTWRKAVRIDDPYYIAMADFYLGELEHRAFAELPLRPADDELKADLAAREAAAARAYDHWKDALVLKDPYWSLAAGYEMSQIFEELWESAVRAPFPAGMTPEARPYYVTEVHDRVRRHLETALEGHQMNVKLAAAYGVDNAWSRASALKAGEILGILSREARGEAVVPPVASATPTP